MAGRNIFDDDSARRIAATVRGFESQWGNIGGKRANRSLQNRPVIEGELASDLSSGGTASLTVHRGTEGAIAASGETYTVQDRVGFSGVSGDWVIAVRLNEEWRVVSLDPATTAADNCFQVVTDVFCSGGSLVECTRQICLPTEDVGDEDCGGTATGTGSGTGMTTFLCCPNALNNTLYASMTSATCAAFSSQPIVFDSGTGSWNGTFALGTCNSPGRNITLKFYCVGVNFSGWRLDVSFSDTCMSPSMLGPSGGVCSPLSISFQISLDQDCYDSPGSGSSTHTIVITP